MLVFPKVLKLRATAEADESEAPERAGLVELDNEGTDSVLNVARSIADNELDGCEMAGSLEIVKSQSTKASSPGTGT